MSWDSYIDTLKSYSANGAVAEGIISGKDGSLWTSPTTNLPTLDEKSAKQIAGKSTEALTVNGVKFMYLRNSDEDDGTYQIYYKKKGVGNLCCHVTTQCILVALTPEDMAHSTGEANEATKKLATYMVGQGF